MSLAEVRETLTVADLVERSRALRKELVGAGARVDALGGDTGEGMQACFEADLNLISVPTRYGGLSDGEVNFATEALIEICTNLSASDSSLGQNWAVSQLVAREIFHAHDVLPESTLRQVADEILNKGVRFVASNAETGSSSPVTARDVPGGIRVKGVKTFNSNSGGGGYANVGFKREVYVGRYYAIIPLDAEGVIQHHDWDNMGQRGTYSQAITYDDVFVPDGWHYHNTSFAPAFLPFAFLIHSSLMLGAGMGALDAGLEHLRATKRVILVQFPESGDDPLMMRRVGAFAARLRAAHALQKEVSRELETAHDAAAMKEVMVHAFANKAVCLETALEVTSGVFDLTGARSTANKNRLDRFWRNARTFAVHDPVDVMQVWVGGWELDRREPNLFAQFRV